MAFNDFTQWLHCIVGNVEAQQALKRKKNLSNNNGDISGSAVSILFICKLSAYAVLD